jgi:lipooligosaccharide transport system permease protein
MTGSLFAAIGIVFSLRSPNIDLFSFYFTLFLTPLFLFSDVFFPLEERLTTPWLWVAEALPCFIPFGWPGRPLAASSLPLLCGILVTYLAPPWGSFFGRAGACASG